MCVTSTLIYEKKNKKLVIKVSQSLIYKSFEGLGGREFEYTQKKRGEEFYTQEKGAITQVV